MKKFIIFMILMVCSSVFGQKSKPWTIDLWRPVDCELGLSFDRSEGVDASHNAYSLSVSGATAGSGYMEFDGDNDLIQITNDAGLQFGTDVSFTVSCWVYVDSTADGNYHIVFMGGNSQSLLEYYLVWLDSGNNFEFGTGDGTFPYGAVATSGGKSAATWYHLVGVYNGSNDRSTIYIDTTTSLSSTPLDQGNTSTDDFGLGACDSGTRRYLNGRLDDVRIFRRALSERQVEELYYEGRE